jgi:predicted ArsR family transcriptional regulator
MEPSAPTLPPELRAFLYSCIDSVDQAELLLHLRHVGRALSVRELAGNLGLASLPVRQHLETLTARGLLRADVGEEVRYRYAPDSERLRGYGELLADHYAADRDAVRRSISARAARTFADAFKIRKEP